MTVTKITFVVYPSGDLYIAQGLEYDLATQAKTFSGLTASIDRLLDCRAAVARRRGLASPFEGLEPAPQRFHDMALGAPITRSEKRSTAAVDAELALA